MLFVDGVFHADPHAGNLLLLPDGRLGLLDFGQVSHTCSILDFVFAINFHQSLFLDLSYESMRAMLQVELWGLNMPKY